MSREPFAEMYQPDTRDKAIFGKYLVAHGTFSTRGEWQMVARIPSTSSDGRDVEIDECRLPARSFRLRVPGVPEFVLSTGSGDAMGRLMVTLGEQIAEGMVAWEQP